MTNIITESHDSPPYFQHRLVPTSYPICKTMLINQVLVDSVLRTNYLTLTLSIKNSAIAILTVDSGEEACAVHDEEEAVFNLFAEGFVVSKEAVSCTMGGLFRFEGDGLGQRLPVAAKSQKEHTYALPLYLWKYKRKD
jgi:hypothetical protein